MRDVKKALKLHEEIFKLLDRVEAVEASWGFFYRDSSPRAMIRVLLQEVRQKEERLRELTEEVET